MNKNLVEKTHHQTFELLREEKACNFEKGKPSYTLFA
jgi:hypothetical protein